MELKLAARMADLSQSERQLVMALPRSVYGEKDEREGYRKRWSSKHCNGERNKYLDRPGMGVVHGKQAGTTVDKTLPQANMPSPPDLDLFLRNLSSSYHAGHLIQRRGALVCLTFDVDRRDSQSQRTRLLRLGYAYTLQKTH